MHDLKGIGGRDIRYLYKKSFVSMRTINYHIIILSQHLQPVCLVTGPAYFGKGGNVSNRLLSRIRRNGTGKEIQCL